MAVDPVSLAINAALFAANMAITASQSFEGPRLEDLSVNTADYGTPLTYFYGERKFDGCICFFAEPLHEIKEHHKTKGGKYNEYTYFGTWATLIADQPIGGVLKVWFDRHLVYDATSPTRTATTPLEFLAFSLEAKGSLAVNRFMRFYLGTEDQLPDERMSATIDAEFGEGSTPAYRGVSYIMFEEVPLEKVGNRLPQVSILAATAASDIFPYEVIDTEIAKPYQPSLDSVCFAPDYSRYYFTDQSGHYSILDMTARQTMVSGTFEAVAYGSISGVDQKGYWYVPLNASVGIGKFSPDGTVLIDTLAVIGSFAHSGCQVFNYSDGSDYLCIYPVLTSTALYAQRVDFPDTIVAINTADLGDTWTPTAYVSAGSDGDETLWAVGVEQSAFGNPTEVFFLQIANSGDLVAPLTYGSVTLPAGLGSLASVDCCWSPTGHFVLHAGGVLYKIEPGFTISASTPIPFSTAAETPSQFRTLRSGSTSIWLGAYEVDLDTLETIRVVAPGDWGHGGWSGGKIYDPVNHAILNTGGILADNEIFWNFLDRLDGSGTTLRTIVEDVAQRCGLDPDEDIDATDLTQTVSGYSWQQGTGKAILEPILEAYDSEARPHNFITEFLRRGVAVGGSVPVADMGAGKSKRYEVPFTGETDLPLKVSLTFADLDADQAPNTAMGQRSGQSVDSRRELSLDATTLALDPDQARQMADGYLRRTWMKAQTANLSLTRAWTVLEPGDAHALVLDDLTLNAKLTRLEFGANGVLTTEWERYHPSIHTPTSLTGAGGDGLIQGEIPIFGYTKGVALDVPLVTDGDENTLPLLYLAACPYSDAISWPGALFMRSSDAGLTYDEELGAVATSERAAIGHMLSALPDALSTIWDEASVVSVKMFSGTLASATSAEVKNGANRAAIRSGDAFEIVGFRTATLIAEKTYQLSGFLRGRRGTDQTTGGHGTGDDFVLLTAVPKTTMAAADIADPLYVKPVTQGGYAGFPQTIDPYTGASLKPYSVAHLEVVDSGGDWVATWRRRTRIGGAWRNFQGISLGEGSEGYVGQVLNAGGAVIRTFSGLTTPTLTYTAAQQATDGGLGVTLRVYQSGSTVNGYTRDVALV